MPDDTLANAQAAAYYAYQAGFRGQDLITSVAVALAESSARADAIGDQSLQDSTWGPSIGLWQVRSLNSEYGTGGLRDGSRLSDPSFNAHSAYILFKSSGWNPWSAHKNGNYKQFLNIARTAATTAGDFNPDEMTSTEGPVPAADDPEMFKQVFSTFVGRDPNTDEMDRYLGKDNWRKQVQGSEEAQAFEAASSANTLSQIMEGNKVG